MHSRDYQIVVHLQQFLQKRKIFLLYFVESNQLGYFGVLKNLMFAPTSTLKIF